MIKLIPRKDVLVNYPKMPWIVYNQASDEEKVHMPKGVAYLVISSTASTYARNVNQICKEMIIVFKQIKLHDFLIMGAQETPWRFRQHRYTDLTVTRTMEFLTESGICPRFNGAVSVPLAKFAAWFKQMLYCVRVNAVVQDMFFMDIHQSIYFSPM